jgi:non-canonical poly(A) RNA polymerase PAPD5/7
LGSHAFAAVRDIDLVVIAPSVQPYKVVRALKLIANAVNRSHIGHSVIVITRAKVPIVKFVSQHGGFSIDISINQTNGLRSSAVVTKCLKDVGDTAARALIFVVKALLQQRGLNEVFSGGLSSYSIICLVVSFLQVCRAVFRECDHHSDTILRPAASQGPDR